MIPTAPGATPPDEPPLGDDDSIVSQALSE